MKSLANQENQALEKEGKGNEGWIEFFFAFIILFLREDQYGRDIVYDFHAEQHLARATIGGSFGEPGALGYDKAIYGLADPVARAGALIACLQGLRKLEYDRANERPVFASHLSSGASDWPISKAEGVLNGVLRIPLRKIQTFPLRCSQPSMLQDLLPECA